MERMSIKYEYNFSINDLVIWAFTEDQNKTWICFRKNKQKVKNCTHMNFPLWTYCCFNSSVLSSQKICNSHIYMLMSRSSRSKMSISMEKFALRGNQPIKFLHWSLICVNLLHWLNLKAKIVGDSIFSHVCVFFQIQLIYFWLNITIVSIKYLYFNLML